MKRGIALAGAVCLVVVLLALALGRLNRMMEPVISPVSYTNAIPVILDAGHGGEDGGAVSLTGVPESQINLEIVLKLRDILALCGTDPQLLREEDLSLHDESASTLREKKRSDLQNRVAAVEAAEGAALISIHQNTYTSARYHGAQVFFAPTQGSQALAEAFQTALRERLQPDNERAAKEIPDSVYLMNHITCPAILVECGFLTNPQEEALLRDEGYQRKLAAVLAGAWLTGQEKADLQPEENLLQ